MAILIAIGAGGFVGWMEARRRGGDRLDRLQYAAVYAILSALVVVISMIVVARIWGG